MSYSPFSDSSGISSMNDFSDEQKVSYFFAAISGIRAEKHTCLLNSQFSSSVQTEIQQQETSSIFPNQRTKKVTEQKNPTSPAWGSVNGQDQPDQTYELWKGFSFAQLPAHNLEMFLNNRSQYNRLSVMGHIQEFRLVQCKCCDSMIPDQPEIMPLTNMELVQAIIESAEQSVNQNYTNAELYYQQQQLQHQQQQQAYLLSQKIPPNYRQYNNNNRNFNGGYYYQNSQGANQRTTNYRTGSRQQQMYNNNFNPAVNGRKTLLHY